jgi:hypothetical protein
MVRKSILVAALCCVALGARAASIPQGAHRLTMQQLTLTAPCSHAITVRSLTVHHGGLGDLRDIEGVYVIEGDTRLSRRLSFGSQSTATLVLRSFTIAPCAKRTISIVIDLSPSAAAGGQHVVGIMDGLDIDSQQQTLEWHVDQGEVTQIVPSAVGSVNISYLSLDASQMLYGHARVLLRMQLRADATHDQTILAATITNLGKARDGDIQNLFIESSAGIRLTPVAVALQGDHIRLMFDPPLSLERNETKTLILRGDITASRRRTIRFTIEEPSDLEATPKMRAFGSPLRQH